VTDIDHQLDFDRAGVSKTVVSLCWH